MKILIACEFSGVVRNEFANRGHDVTSCDLEPSLTQGNHYHGDVLDILHDNWDLIIAHPPCTYLCNSGVRWLKTEDGRYEKMLKASEFFSLFLNHPCPRICIENPIMHSYAKTAIGGIKESQIIHPWMFGHTQQKATCLWLKFLPPLKETNNVYDKMANMPYSERAIVHYASPGKDRWKLRSITYKGIAKAMATQWSERL